MNTAYKVKRNGVEYMTEQGLRKVFQVDFPTYLLERKYPHEIATVLLEKRIIPKLYECLRARRANMVDDRPDIPAGSNEHRPDGIDAGNSTTVEQATISSHPNPS